MLHYRISIAAFELLRYAIYTTDRCIFITDLIRTTKRRSVNKASNKKSSQRHLVSQATRTFLAMRKRAHSPGRIQDSWSTIIYTARRVWRNVRNCSKIGGKKSPRIGGKNLPPYIIAGGSFSAYLRLTERFGQNASSIYKCGEIRTQGYFVVFRIVAFRLHCILVQRLN